MILQTFVEQTPSPCPSWSCSRMKRGVGRREERRRKKKKKKRFWLRFSCYYHCSVYLANLLTMT